MKTIDELSSEAQAHYWRHLSLSKRMQSGVAFDLERNGTESGKHLRVGVNVALVDSAALAGLLVDKGVITAEEYFTAIADGMEREVKRYEEKLGVNLGEAGFP